MSKGKAILGKHRLRRVTEPTPEWAPELPEVTLRQFTAHDKDIWDMYCADQKKAGTERKMNFRAFAVRLAAIEEDGTNQGVRLFDDEDVDALAVESGEVIGRLFTQLATIEATFQDEESEKNSSRSAPDSTSPTP